MQTAASLLQLHNETHGSLKLLFDHCRQFTSGQLMQEFEGFGYPSLHAQLSHIIEVEDMWVAKLKAPGGGPLPFAWVEGQPGETVSQLEAVRQVVADATRAFIEQTGDGRLNVQLTLHWPEEGPNAFEVRTPAFILIHAMTHTFHHKGQAVALCRLLGSPAPDTDIQRADERK